MSNTDNVHRLVREEPWVDELEALATPAPDAVVDPLPVHDPDTAVSAKRGFPRWVMGVVGALGAGAVIAFVVLPQLDISAQSASQDVAPVDPLVQLQQQVTASLKQQDQVSAQLAQRLNDTEADSRRIHEVLSQIKTELGEVQGRLDAQGEELKQHASQLEALQQSVQGLEVARKVAETRTKATTPTVAKKRVRPVAAAPEPKPEEVIALPFAVVSVDSYDLREYATLRVPGRGLVSVGARDFVNAWRVVRIDGIDKRVEFENLAGVRRSLSVE